MATLKVTCTCYTHFESEAFKTSNRVAAICRAAISNKSRETLEERFCTLIALRAKEEIDLPCKIFPALQSTTEL